MICFYYVCTHFYRGGNLFKMWHLQDTYFIHMQNNFHFLYKNFFFKVYDRFELINPTKSIFYIIVNLLFPSWRNISNFLQQVFARGWKKIANWMDVKIKKTYTNKTKLYFPIDLQFKLSFCVRQTLWMRQRP